MRKSVNIFLAVMVILFFASCQQPAKQGTAVIVREHLFDSIPSGSGLELYHDSLIIIGDDAADVYQVSLHDYRYKKIPLQSDPSLYRYDKSVKRDFESATIVNYRGGDYLLLFGSGSKSPQRDSMLIMDLQRMQVDTIVSLRPFYSHLLKLTNTTPDHWNLEGSAIVENQLALLNRGNNMLYQLSAEKFIDHVLTKGNPPAVEFKKETLSSIEDYEARFSGAATLENRMLFSASVEKTTDWTKDGPIAGSFVGIINIRNENVVTSAALVYPDGKRALEKIESLIFLRKDSGGDIIVLAISDNDDGKTKLMEVKISKENQ